MPTVYAKSSCEESLGESTDVSKFKGTENDVFDATKFNDLITKLKNLF